jgi:peptide deformylase|tara:strand:- start:649 stop:1095 length:447 start_codon:yes stop_codon:yes gene_type:complete
MIKNLIPIDNPLLHQRIKKCSYDLDRSKLSYTLTENMFHYNGVGLSANQIGINERVFVMMSDIETEETITCFNPKIIKESKKIVVYEEGCLSYPNLKLNISRPATIVVKYEDEGKELHKIKLEGFIARIFQHEYDHMEGIDFTQRSSK